MAIQHIDIPDNKRHEVKGASTATLNQVLKSNGDATTSFVNPNTLPNISVASILEGQSFITQNPIALDTPYQVLWGSAVSNADCSIASNGVVTINTTGLYSITFNLNFGRSNNVGISKLVARLETNGTPTGFVQVCQMDTSTNISPFNGTVLRSFSTTNIITLQLLRDSTGANDGGLYTFDPVLAGWSNSPSAAIRIQRIAGGV